MNNNWIWDGSILAYQPFPEAQGWYMDGFRLCNGQTSDLRDSYGLLVTFEESGRDEFLKIKGTGLMNRDQLNEEMTINPQLEITVPAGKKKVTIPFADFDYREGHKLFWGYMKSFEVDTNLKIQDVEIVEGDPLKITVPVKSRHAAPGAEIHYDMQIKNCSKRSVTVRMKHQVYGWETCTVSIADRQFTLAADEEKTTVIAVTVGRDIIPSGRENQKIIILADDRTDTAETVEFITGAEIAHPYLLHNEDGWQHVKDKISQYVWAREDFEYYIEKAEKFIPERISGDYVRNAEDQNSVNGFIITLKAEECMCSAISYKLTGEHKYAEKCAALMRILYKEYPDRNQASTQALVQEGHFFQQMAIAADLIWDEGFLTPEDKAGLEKTFRVFMDIVDKELYLGGISNHYLAEIVGCLTAAMVLQDDERIQRFLYGHSGFMVHLAKGVFDDGWYYECSLGYNLWVLVLYMQTGIGLEKLGYYILNEKVPTYYSENINIASEELYGLTLAQWGPRNKSYRNLEMMVDSLLRYSDYRGIVFAMNDSQDQNINTRRHGFKPYDLAYYIFKKPEYGYMATMNEGGRCCIYGEEFQEEFDGAYLYRESTHSGNAGYAVLRNQNSNDKDRIQAVMHYGSHGGYHGHFDRLDLVSLMRYGKSFYFPEVIWYGYGSHLYKFLMQNSITHNMTVVDGKNQEAVPAEELLFYRGKYIQVSSAKVNARWANPPYGGMRYSPDQSLEDKALEEGRTFRFPQQQPAYGEITDYTEPVRQERTMVLTDHYLLIHDCLSAEQKHCYDYMFQPKALKEIKGAKKTGNISQLDKNPLSSGQFITDCDIYTPESSQVRLFFNMDLKSDPTESSRMQIEGDGLLKLDLYQLDAENTEIISGRTPVNRDIRKRVHYEVWTEDTCVKKGDTGAWILGAVSLDIPVKAGKEIELRLQISDFPEKFPELYDYHKADDVLFLADRRSLADDFQKRETGLDINDDGCVLLSQMDITGENTNSSDKEEIIIEGVHYDSFTCVNPADYEKETVIRLKGEKEGTLKLVLGCNYPPEKNGQERRTIALRKQGKCAEFLTVIEVYEEERMIEQIHYDASANKINITLKNGQNDELILMKDKKNNVKYESGIRGELIREDTFSPETDG